MDSCVEDNNWTLWMELWVRAADEYLRQARQELDERWRALITRIVRDGIARGVFKPANGDEAGLALAALLDGLAVQVTLSDRTIKGNL